MINKQMLHITMRSSLLLTIIFMGLMSVVFTLFTGEVYLQQTLDNRRQTFTELVELDVHNHWDQLKAETEALAMSIQSGFVYKKKTS